MEYYVDVRFSKNVSEPMYGNEAYHIEYHNIKLTYGKNGEFKTAKDAVNFAKSKITSKDLFYFSCVEIYVMRGGSGRGEFLKYEIVKMNKAPLDKELCEFILKR